MLLQRGFPAATWGCTLILAKSSLEAREVEAETINGGKYGEGSDS